MASKIEFDESRLAEASAGFDLLPLPIRQRFPSPTDDNETKIKKFNLLVKTWNTQSELWPVTRGPYILGALSACSAFYISRFYQTKFLLTKVALIPIAIPVAYTGSMAGFYNYFCAIPNMVTGKIKCAACAQIRSGVVQVSLSTVCPIILASLGSMFLAVRTKSYALPPRLFESAIARHQTFHIWKNINKSAFKKFTIIGLFNFFFPQFMIFEQQLTYYNLHKHFLSEHATPKI